MLEKTAHMKILCNNFNYLYNKICTALRAPSVLVTFDLDVFFKNIYTYYRILMCFSYSTEIGV